MSYCPDPRPLSPPDYDDSSELRPVWHLLTEDWEHEHWIDTERELHELLLEYSERATPFTLTRELVSD